MDVGNAFVLDGSVTIVWGFDDEDDAYAMAILDRMPDLTAHVPSMWSLEIANATLVGERRGRTTPAKAALFLSLLGTFPISVDDETVTRAWSETMELARAHHLSAYDASYLELAIRLGLPLACLDGRLRAAAHATGVAEFTVA